MTERDQPAKPDLPNWAKRERENDLGWIALYADAFWLAASYR